MLGESHICVIVELTEPAQGVQAGLGALPRHDAVAPQDGRPRAPQPDEDHHTT